VLKWLGNPLSGWMEAKLGVWIVELMDTKVDGE
jgi:hypothetical protein